MPHDVKMITRKEMDQPKTKLKELISDLKAAGTTVTISDTLHCNGLKSHSTRNPPALERTFTMIII